ncbi:hypothetical protein CORC01_03866 [Colletotrichum orchidophilum]|uniref:Uncharacterized protein n=1 Tax=Colletotrichum orchidophilum TaxID=1209926 RepID=A0A1G4BHB0_9PEZI|nr:uncharacterized protein CORC01_03866 [Colletotrichum orchidophilum]OHF00792.1 hypothetical protein CORC01_03866 [Colletotrichum orchidophilum]
MANARLQRVEANCKIIWGDHFEYDLDCETDDYIHFSYVVKRDFGTSFGPPLTMTGPCGSEEAAFKELDRMLGLWAAQVTRGTPMTREESLKIFGGPRGGQRWILNRVWDTLEKREGAV